MVEGVVSDVTTKIGVTGYRIDPKIAGVSCFVPIDPELRSKDPCYYQHGHFPGISSRSDDPRGTCHQHDGLESMFLPWSKMTCTDDIGPGGLDPIREGPELR
jgi:hypothetical protein